MHPFKNMSYFYSVVEFILTKIVYFLSLFFSHYLCNHLLSTEYSVQARARWPAGSLKLISQLLNQTVTIFFVKKENKETPICYNVVRNKKNTIIYINTTFWCTLFIFLPNLCLLTKDRRRWCFNKSRPRFDWPRKKKKWYVYSLTTDAEGSFFIVFC